MSKKAFLICPVRGANLDSTDELVAALESGAYDGTKWDVHYPPRDTDQRDDIGLRICQDNRAAIVGADMVFIVWDGKSQGTLFDAGAAFALNKPLRCVSLPEPTNGKSFQNMMRTWEAHDPETD